MKHLLNWALSALAVWIVARLVPGFHVSGPLAALIAALVIGFVNATLGVFLKIVTFPLVLLTLGLFWLVINAAMIELASAVVPGFHVDTFGAAFVGAVVLALVNMFFPLAGGNRQKPRLSAAGKNAPALDTTSHAKPVVSIFKFRRDAGTRRRPRHLDVMAPRASARCPPTAERRPLRIALGRNGIIARVVPIGAPFMHVVAKIVEAIRIRCV